MINVLYLVDAPFLGGAERFIIRIATGLDRARFRPSVIMRGPVHPNSGLSQWRSELEEAGVPVRTVAMDIPFRPWRAVAVLRAVADASPHVAHVNLPGPMDGQMGLLVPISRMAGARGVVVTEHLPMLDNTRKRGLLKRISYRWVDRVTTVCRANVPYLVEKQFVPPAKAVVIHNALDGAYGAGAPGNADSTRARFGLPPDSVVVLFVGNLLKHKGLHRLIRALSQAESLPWHLFVVGEGPERAPCEKHIETAGLGGRATFAGRLSGAEVEDVLSAADVLALPSTIEGMPYVILEAMASGVPVVSTTVFGIPEMVVTEETGLLVDPGDEAGLRDALTRLIADPGDRERMGRSARLRFEQHFTVDRQLREIEALYVETARMEPGGVKDTDR